MVRLLRRRSGRASIFALPLVTAAVFHLYRMEWPGLRMFTILACAYGAVAAAIFVLVWRSPVETRAMARTVAGLQHDLWKQRMALQTHIEVLSAEREISLILREDVDFRAILEKVLRVVAGMVGGDGAIEVFLRDEVKAVWSQGKAWFDGEPERRILLRGPGIRTLEAPLAYDGETIGRVRLRAVLEGSAADQEERARLLAHHFQELAGFVALAIKTPDLYTRAIEDALTGLATKRHFLGQMTTTMEGARRGGTPLSLIMIDIDHFKKINDRYGHVAGDQVLKGVAEVLRKGIRSRAGDAAYNGFRYGGEELSILLPGTGLARAGQVAERIRAAIAAKPVAGVKVTASFGVAQFEPAFATPEEFIARADEALYRAKEGGRNRVEVARSAASRIG